jgi:hypothetical protein
MELRPEKLKGAYGKFAVVSISEIGRPTELNKAWLGPTAPGMAWPGLS